MTPTSVGMRCPECARQRTRVRTVRTGGGDPVVTYALIVLNVIVTLAELVGGTTASGSSLGGGSLIDNGALSRPTVADGELWRLVTAGFLHAGLAHLLFNMLALYVLGTMLEPAVGRLRFGVIYFVSLLAGSFGALLATKAGNTVGASGAIFGLMGAAVVVLRNRGVSPMQSGLGFWIGLNLLITFSVPGISIGGHVGGLIGGALAAGALFELRDHVRLPAAAPLALALALGAAAIAGSIAVASS
jgi:membrane associated rhomboid family serine protease